MAVGEVEADDGSFSDLAGDTETAAVQRGDLAADRKAEAGPPGPATGRAFFAETLPRRVFCAEKKQGVGDAPGDVSAGNQMPAADII